MAKSNVIHYFCFFDILQISENVQSTEYKAQSCSTELTIQRSRFLSRYILLRAFKARFLNVL
jgi:hypothetical protein